jgi:hypothetical protein
MVDRVMRFLFGTRAPLRYRLAVMLGGLGGVSTVAILLGAGYASPVVGSAVTAVALGALEVWWDSRR